MVVVIHIFKIAVYTVISLSNITEHGTLETMITIFSDVPLARFSKSMVLIKWVVQAV
jgi:hypothetical protein